MFGRRRPGIAGLCRIPALYDLRASPHRTDATHPPVSVLPWEQARWPDCLQRDRDTPQRAAFLDRLDDQIRAINDIIARKDLSSGHGNRLPFIPSLPRPRDAPLRMQG